MISSIRQYEVRSGDCHHHEAEPDDMQLDEGSNPRLNISDVSSPKRQQKWRAAPETKTILFFKEGESGEIWFPYSDE